MKYLRPALTMLLLVSFVAMNTFAKNEPKKTGNSEFDVKVAKLTPATALKKTSKLSGRAVEMAENTAISEQAFANQQADRRFGESSMQEKPQLTMPANPRAISDLTPLSGNYTIGTGGDFPTLSAAVGVLNFLGVSGPTTFLFTDATYSDYGVVVGAVKGASATNTITFRPASTASTVTITLLSNTSTAVGGGWVFNGSKYVTINGTKVGGTPLSQDMTIRFDPAMAVPSSQSNGVLRLRDGVQFINVLNTKLAGVLTTTGGSACIGMSSSTGIDSVTDPDLHTLVLRACLDVTIDNCTFTNARHGVYSNGLVALVSADYANYDRRITVSNSFFGSTYGGNIAQWAIRLDGSRNCTISGNHIDGISYPSTFATDAGRVGGIRWEGYKNVCVGNWVNNVVENNTAASSSNRTYGIRAMSPAGHGALNSGADPYVVNLGNLISGHRVSNNAISNIWSYGSNAIGEIGLEIFAGIIDTVDNNSIYMTGTHLEKSGTACVQGQGAIRFSAITLYSNNVFYNNRASSTQWSVGIRNFDYAGQGADYDYDGSSDNNVINGPDYIMSNLSTYGYSTMYEFSTSEGTDAHSSSGDPYFTSASDLHFQSAQPSSAAERGKAVLTGAVAARTTDIEGTTRNTPPDAGAYEGSISVPTDHDVAAAGLVSPSNMPTGLPIASFTAAVANLSQNTEVGVSVNLTVKNPSDVVVYNQNAVTDTLAWGGVANVEFPGPFTPADQGDYTFTITTSLAGDADASNDVFEAAVPSAGESAFPYSTSFESSGDRAGWGTSGDFALASVTGGDTKLGGAKTGDKAYQTNPGAHGTVYSAATVSYLYSPYFDFTGKTKAVLSFWHSMITEPGWDRSIVEYSLDTGKTWLTLGSLNDPDGSNWYSEAVYHNAGLELLDQSGATIFDESTAGDLGWPAENPGVAPHGDWTSNYDLSPSGYVKVSYNLGAITAARNPLGKHWVRFRYATFSDFSGTDDGWAFDDFSLDTSTFVYPLNATASGTVFTDDNGDGSASGDVGIDGQKVYVSFGGVVADSATTAGGGNYTVNLAKGIGTYSLTSTVTGKALTTSSSFSYNGDGTPLTGKDLGYYQGSISGRVFSDANNNGADDADAGVSGWTVTVHKDSATGATAGTATTDGTGAYSVTVGPGSYVVVQTQQTGYRATTGNNLAATVSGSSGSGSSAVTGKTFGQFKLATIRVYGSIDLNGDGVLNETVVKLPVGVFAAYKVKKNGALQKYDSLGNGAVSELTVTNADTGTYKVYFLRGPNATQFTRTAGSPDSTTIVVAASGQVDTAKYLWFKNGSTAGKVVNDVNGNGTIDGGDNGLSGWTVNISGTGATSTVTDGSGNFSLTGVAPGAHTVTLTTPAGYTKTKHAAGYTFTLSSGQNLSDSNFAVFHNFAAAGKVYRDRDNSGTQNTGDDALAGVVVSLTKDGNPAGADTSDASGNFSFADLGPGAYVLSGAAPSGYGQTQPASAGTIGFSGVSGADTLNNTFGFFHLTDSVKYRTITAADIISNWTKAKPATNLKKDTVENFANLLNENLLNTYVGLVGTAKGSGGYFQPKKYTDVQKSTGADGKSPAHSGSPTGFDFTAKGKIMNAGKYAAVPSTLQNNVLFANLLALRINIAASDNGNTPAGLSSLVINDGGQFDGMTISAFAAKMDTVMTNWKKVPQSVFDDGNAMAAAINAAFNATFNPDHAAFRADGKIHLAGAHTVYEVSFLLPATHLVPKSQPPAQTEEVMPTVYALYQNYPNPFNPTTNIRFDLPMASIVTVKIYNMIGQEVATLFTSEQMDAGQVEVPFNATNLASGVYFYRVTAEGLSDDGFNTGDTFSKVMKMLLVK